jgi:MFS family permease
MRPADVRAWAAVGGFGLVFFQITAATYSSLGVVLPDMVRDQGWTWTQAGLGFTLMGAATGGSSTVPSMLIRRIGVRPTLVLGTAVITAGFVCFSLTRSPLVYFLGAVLCGVGFQMQAVIPATFVLAALFPRRGLPFGVYFAAGSAGGVAGPVLALAVIRAFDHQWRLFWLIQAGAAIVAGLTCVALVGGPAWLARRAAQTDAALADPVASQAAPSAKAARIYRTAEAWTARQALRTSQFYVLLAAYFAHLLIAIVVSGVSVAHLTERGVDATVAGVMLSLESLVGVAGRAVGGVLGDIVEPRRLLLFALAALSLGGTALSVADAYPMMLVYVIGSGLGFGLVSVVVPLLLLNYYGRKHNLEIFALTALIGAVSASGTLIAGAIRDQTGGFAPAIQIFALAAAVVLAAALFMRPPTRRAEAAL